MAQDLRRFGVARGVGAALLALGLVWASAGVAGETGKNAQRPAQNTKDAGDDADHEVSDSARKAGHSIKQAAEDTGEVLKDAGKKTGKALDGFGHNVAHFFKHLFD